VGPKIKILIYLFSKTLPQKFQRRYFFSHPLTLSPKIPTPNRHSLCPFSLHWWRRAVEERNGAGGVEGAEVAAGPVELEVDAADMGAARAAAWRQRGLRRRRHSGGRGGGCRPGGVGGRCGRHGVSAGRGVEAARAAASMRRRRSGRSPRWLPAPGKCGALCDRTSRSWRPSSSSSSDCVRLPDQRLLRHGVQHRAAAGGVAGGHRRHGRRYNEDYPLKGARYGAACRRAQLQVR
jgi:hypothetical protein